MKSVIYSMALSILIISSCTTGKRDAALSIRYPIDSVGFAVTAQQMDGVMSRLSWYPDTVNGDNPWKVCISPHDDYIYVNDIYPQLLQNIKSDIVILFGVAHKAASLGLADSLVFDSHDYWSGPYGNVKISDIRSEIESLLPENLYTVNDSMHKIEHSLESLIPFLQYFNRDIEIIPILVPFMSPEKMRETGDALALAIDKIIKERSLEPGSDISIVITSDAVHYGNEDWGGKDQAEFGCDTLGNSMAMNREREILEKCLTGELTEEKIKLFSSYTLQSDDYHVYKWTWCGRYSIPVGLYTSLKLFGSDLEQGKLIAYSTSITNKHIDFRDLGMGTTAIATACHWVGYPAIGF